MVKVEGLSLSADWRRANVSHSAVEADGRDRGRRCARPARLPAEDYGGGLA
jgi:hypothetical protein